MSSQKDWVHDGELTELELHPEQVSLLLPHSVARKQTLQRLRYPAFCTVLTWFCKLLIRDLELWVLDSAEDIRDNSELIRDWADVSCDFVVFICDWEDMICDWAVCIWDWSESMSWRCAAMICSRRSIALSWYNTTEHHFHYRHHHHQTQSNFETRLLALVAVENSQLYKPSQITLKWLNKLPHHCYYKPHCIISFYVVALFSPYMYTDFATAKTSGNMWTRA